MPRMTRHCLPPLLTLLLAAGCAPGPAAAPRPAKAPAPAPAAPRPAAPAAGAAAYQGLGAESLPPEVVAQFASPPLPGELSRRIQAMLDVRAPAAGVPASDGKSLFFTWSVTGVRQVWRLDGPKAFPVQLTGGEDATWVVGVSPDGKRVFVQRDRKGEENPGLYVQPAAGGALEAIQHVPKVQTAFERVTDDGRYVYYRANDVKKDSYAIYRYDLQAKRRELVFGEEGLWGVADEAGGKLLLAKETGGSSREFYEYDPAAKKLTPLFGQDEREDYQAAYGAAPGEVLVLTPKMGEFRRLYRWKGGQYAPATPEIKHDVSGFQIDRKRQRVLYEVNENGYTRLHVLDPRSLRELPAPPLPPGDHAFPAATSPDGRFTSFGVDPGKGPTTGYVYDWAARKLTQWHAPSAPEVDPASFAKAALESYPARDGTQVPMFVRRPPKCDGPCPVIVHFHGGPEGQSVAGFNARAQLFVDAGFVFVEPNVRGSVGYGKTWEHADDGPKRLQVVTDIEDAAKYVRTAWAQGGRAPKVGIFGGSYGGYSTLVGMTMFAGAYDAGVSVVGISNLLTFLENTAPYRRILRVSEYGDPAKDKEALVKLSPVTYLDRVKAPIMLIQGLSDPRVPAGEALQMHNALRAKGLDSQLIIFPDEGHGAQKRENQVATLGHALRFFQKHLLGEAAAPKAPPPVESTGKPAAAAPQASAKLTSRRGPPPRRGPRPGRPGRTRTASHRRAPGRRAPARVRPRPRPAGRTQTPTKGSARRELFRPRGRGKDRDDGQERFGQRALVPPVRQHRERELFDNGLDRRRLDPRAFELAGAGRAGGRHERLVAGPEKALSRTERARQDVHVRKIKRHDEHRRARAAFAQAPEGARLGGGGEPARVALEGAAHDGQARRIALDAEQRAVHGDRGQAEARRVFAGGLEPAPPFAVAETRVRGRRRPRRLGVVTERAEPRVPQGVRRRGGRDAGQGGRERVAPCEVRAAPDVGRPTEPSSVAFTHRRDRIGGGRGGPTSLRPGARRRGRGGSGPRRVDVLAPGGLGDEVEAGQARGGSTSLRPAREVACRGARPQTGTATNALI
jgi:dipeptidyl aminopeptidase/acylaminoacyl peptidase